MTETKCTILQTTDLDVRDSSPIVACLTDAGWLAVRFDSDEQIYVATLSEAEVTELGLSLDDFDAVRALTVNRIPYSGWGILRPYGWGEDLGGSWRTQRAKEPGWLDRECRMYWSRVYSMSMEATPSAQKKLRALVETVVAELIADRPALVDFGQAANLRQQIQRTEDLISAIDRQRFDKVRELTSLRAQFKDMNR